MIERAWLSLDLAALSHNYIQIKNLVADDVAIVPMVKANGYGHGAVLVAKQLQEADGFGVAALDEAIELRQAGISQPIYVLSGYSEADAINLFVEHDLIAIIHCIEQITWLEQADISQSITVWLKLDTGMHRLGVSADEFDDCLQRLENCNYVNKPVGIMSHFADADADEIVTQQQVDLFEQLTQGLDNPKSLANSAGIYNFKHSHQDVVRPGIMLYGVSPFADKTATELGLKPVMTLSSKLIAIKKIKAGEHVGYGRTWTADKDSVIGIVAIGYGDGYPRHISNGTPVLINNKICPTVGCVSMDMLAVDLSELETAAINDKVILWGDGLPVEQIAQSAETIAYELFCQLTMRIKR